EQVTRANGNLTDQMLAFLTLHRLPPEQRSEPGFQRMLRGFAALAEKDLAVTLAFASAHGVALPGTALCREQMNRVYGVADAPTQARKETAEVEQGYPPKRPCQVRRGHAIHAA